MDERLCIHTKASDDADQFDAVSGLEQQQQYWREQLRGAPELLELPSERPRTARQSGNIGSVGIRLDGELVRQAEELARLHELTLAMVLCAAWSLVLSRLSGQDNFVMGIPMMNRRRSQPGGAIESFVNMRAIWVRLEDDPPASRLLASIKESMVGAYMHQAAPLEYLVEALQPTRSRNSGSIFQVMFVLQSAREWTEADALESMAAAQTMQAELVLWLHETLDGIAGTLSYATDLFDEETVSRWGGYLSTALRSMARDAQARISSLPLIQPDELRVIVEGFNTARVTRAHEQLIHELFERQVEHAPDAIAVLYESTRLTYAQLNTRANQLAHHLRMCGVAPDGLVGLCLERSPEMVIGLLGILKAGGAYVPLDPVYPSERLAQMIDDCRPTVVLTQRALRERLAALSSAELIALDEVSWERGAWRLLPVNNPDAAQIGLRPHHLAYVIYTSGSTGRPKGVMVEHRNVTHFLDGLEACIHGLEPDCRCVAWNSSIGFDMAVKGWGQLTRGRTVCLLPESLRVSPEALVQYLERQGVDAIECTPSHLRVLLRAGLLDGRGSLRKVLLGGEPIDAAMWRTLATAKGAAFFNMYGPTECSVDASCELVAGERPHIGRVMPNARIYILDVHRQPVPIGVTGEIFIGGAGVGRGYLNRPELTAERFGPDPFSDKPQARMYRTGDLGRWRADGVLEYLGRNDHQVKIRGFRIEPGEIEAQLMRHPAVKEAVVMAREDVPGEKRLASYVVAQDASHAPAVEELRGYLKGVLPEYMVPSAFVVLQRMPLTANGKLDRRMLPAPELDAYAARGYEEPLGDMEKTLAGIWQSLLGVERVGRQDNFFELGGHSLLIMAMLEQLRLAGWTVEPSQVFATSTLRHLAEMLKPVTEALEAPESAIPEGGCTTITPQMLPLVELEAEHIERIVRDVPGGAANIQDIYPLAPLQEGILFHHLLNRGGGDTYVMPTVLAVADRERAAAIVSALQALVDRHDVLRTAVLWDQLPLPVQVVYRRAILPVEEVALDGSAEIEDQLRCWIEPRRQWMDLRRAPLMRVRLAPDPRSERWYVLLQRHHIVSDHVTSELLAAEAVAHIEGRAEDLPASAPYRNHVAHVLRHARAHDSQAFFSRKLGDVDEPTAPFGLLNVHADGAEVCEFEEDLDPELVSRIRSQARGLSVSAATLVHAACGLVVAHTSARDDIVFGTLLSGRLQGSTDGRHKLGMYINTLPLRLQLTNCSARQLVEHARQELAELLTHEQASLALAQRCSGIGGAAGPLFSVLVNYVHSNAAADAGWAAARGVRLALLQERTNYPITLTIEDSSRAIRLNAQTDKGVDPRRVTAYVRTALQSLIHALDQDPQTPALELSILPQTERLQLLEEFNETRTPYPRNRLLHELFEEQSSRTPDSIAVTCEGRSLTYAQLNAAANRLARYLLRQGVEAGDYVPLFMRRSIPMLVAQLAVLKSLGTYVPLDPDLPAMRLSFMISDTRACLILTDGRSSNPPQEGVRFVDCEAASDFIATLSDENLGLQPVHAPAAYVMYTSGSTGQPKGVVVPHHAVTRLAIQNNYAHIHEDDRVVHYSNTAFDASTFEVWGALLNGARIVIVLPEAVLDHGRFKAVLREEGVTVLWMTVGLFNQYVAALTDILPTLRYLIVGGDIVEPNVIRRVLRECPPQRLLNAYGPTECTTFTTTHLIEHVDHDATSIPIGRPIANSTVYILDRRGIPAPMNVAGEIFIGGDGVARGYLNRPDLTEERFVPDPFAIESDRRMYRTGDLGRWRSDGSIEFLGRNDQQVKIRGFRIEPGEVETQLARHPQLSQVAVVLRQDPLGNKCLVAYVTRAGEADIAANDLRAYLCNLLPEYMVPSAFVVLDHMPLTVNGKVDRRLLPAPDLGARASRQYEIPRGNTEELLASTWAQLLQLDRIGRDDDFFELGGHSLVAMQALARIEGALSMEVPMKLLFELPTVRTLAEHLDGLRHARLIEQIAHETTQGGELLDQVASLPEDAARELLKQLSADMRP
jgi:amino acid adenylation domain-containing protein